MTPGVLTDVDRFRLTLVLRSAKEGTRRVSRVEAAALHVFGEPAVEIDSDGDLPLHPSLLVEPEGAVVAIVAEILHLQALDGSATRAGVGQCPDHGAVAEADGSRAVDRREEADLPRRCVGRHGGC